jgi:hypothetical protein
MPSKPRDQWIPNPKLQAARERVYGRKSRTPFARAVKRRCEARFGAGCGVDHRKVRKWEEGECVPDVCHQEVICELFGVPWEQRDELGFPVSVVKRSRSKEPEKEPQPEGRKGLSLVNGQSVVCGGRSGAAAWPGGNGKGQNANRRDVHRHLGTAALAFSVPETPLSLGAQLAAALRRPRYLDTAALNGLEALVADFGYRFLSTPAATLLAEVSPRLWQLTRLLDEPLRDGHRQRLCAIIGDLAGVVAWLARGMQDYEGAHACCEAGMLAAQEAGDDELYAYLLASMSDATTDPREAADFAAEAAAVAQHVGGPSTHAWIAGKAAEKLAVVQDGAASRGMLGMAETATNQTEREERPRWVHHWNHSRFLRDQGVVEMCLDQPEAAQAAFADALSSLHPALVKLRSSVMADLAVAHFQQRHVDEGCAWIHQAIDLRAEHGDKLRMDKAGQLKVALRPYMDTPAAQEAAERLGFAAL